LNSCPGIGRSAGLTGPPQKPDKPDIIYIVTGPPPAIPSHVVPIPGLQREIRAGFRDRPHQSAGSQMEHVSGATLQSLAYQQCLTAGVDADQQAMSVQPSAERLFAGDKPIRPGRLLGHLIAGR